MHSILGKLQRFTVKTVAMVTRHPRYVPKIQFEKCAIVHNVFRCAEAVFGRSYGVRKESSVMLNIDGSVIYEFYTIEAALAHFEGYLRGLVPKLKLVRVEVPQFTFAGIGGIRAPMIGIPNYLFAIAYDTSGGTTYGSQPRTVSIATSGSDRLMIMHTSAINDPGSSMPTYNSIASTEIARGTYPGSARTGSCVSYLIAPATGSNTASFPSSGSQLLGQVANYTGCLQVSPVDGNGTTSSTGTSITATVNVTSSNCWIVAGVSDSSGSGYSNNTGTIRVSSANGAVLFDSNGVVGTGSQSISINTANCSWQCVAASIKPSLDIASDAIMFGHFA